MHLQVPKQKTLGQKSLAPAHISVRTVSQDRCRNASSLTVQGQIAVSHVGVSPHVPFANLNLKVAIVT